MACSLAYAVSGEGPAAGDLGDLTHASAIPLGPSDASFKRSRTRAECQGFMEEDMHASMIHSSMIHTMRRSIPAAFVGASLAVAIPASARANVITDWDEKAVVAVTPMPPCTRPSA
jgi:hypothetical protein